MMLYRRRRRGRAGDILALGALAAVLAATAMLVSAIATLIAVMAGVALVAVVAAGLLLAVPTLRVASGRLDRWLWPRDMGAGDGEVAGCGPAPGHPRAERVLTTRRSTLRPR